MTRLRIGGSLACPSRRARAATAPVAHSEPPSSAAPAAPDARRNVLRVSRSDPSIALPLVAEPERIIAGRPPGARRAPRSAPPCRADRVEPLAQRRLGRGRLVEAGAGEAVGHELLVAHLVGVVVRVVVAEAAAERRRAGVRRALEVRRRRLGAELADA